MDDGLDEIRNRYATAIEKYSQHYERSGLFGLPHLSIGVQGFALHYERDEEEEYDHREWLGIMLCAALERLVKMHTADHITSLQKRIVVLEENLWSISLRTAGVPNDLDEATDVIIWVTQVADAALQEE